MALEKAKAITREIHAETMVSIHRGGGGTGCTGWPFKMAKLTTFEHLTRTPGLPYKRAQTDHFQVKANGDIKNSLQDLWELSLPTSHVSSRSFSATSFPSKPLKKSYSCAADFAAAFKNSCNLPAGMGPVTRPWLCCLACNEQKSASGLRLLPHWAPLPPPHTLAKHLAWLTCEGM